MSRMFTQGEWTLLDEDGATAVSFTSFLDIDVRNSGQALSNPVEQGGFIHYNKTQEPRAIEVNLAAQGAESDFEYMLQKLDDYRNRAVRLSVSTPSALYENMTLQSYTYKRGRENNAGSLCVALSLVEVREVQTQTAATAMGRPKNPSSSDRVNVGRVQTRSGERPV